MSDNTHNHRGDQVLTVYKARVDLKSISKQRRRELSHWLAHHCGRPNPLHGLWWTEHSQSSDTVICFVLDQHHTLFTLTWCDSL